MQVDKLVTVAEILVESENNGWLVDRRSDGDEY